VSAFQLFLFLFTLEKVSEIASVGWGTMSLSTHVKKKFCCIVRIGKYVALASLNNDTIMCAYLCGSTLKTIT
jgi:hypothetical protein